MQTFKEYAADYIKNTEYGYAFHNTLGWYVYGVDTFTGAEFNVPGYFKGARGQSIVRYRAKHYTANIKQYGNIAGTAGIIAD